MHIPQNGRVVIIDDEVEKEGLPLIRALTKNNVPTIYFTGKIEELPPKPLSGIRIIFLDIVLGTDGQPARTQIATASNVLKKIIDKNNGPYLLLAWTNHEEHIDGIKAAISDMPPACFLNLEKGTCKDSHGNYDVAKIENKIEEELKKVKAFHIFTVWENLVHQSAGEIVNDFSSFYPISDKWDKQLSTIFFRLAEAHAGKQLQYNQKGEIIKNALLTFNKTFLDSLESKINILKGYKEIELNKGDQSLSNEIIAKINSKLLLIKDVSTAKPGTLYKINANSKDEFQKTIIYDVLDKEKALKSFAKTKSVNYLDLFEADNKLKNTYKKEYKSFEDDLRRKIGSEVAFVLLEISPYCDYAQKKWKLHRVLSGIIWPEKYYELIKKAAYIYKTPLLQMDGAKSNIAGVVFDLRYFKSLTFNQLAKKKIFLRLKHPLLVDIQSHLGRHVNRPGVVFVE